MLLANAAASDNFGLLVPGAPVPVWGVERAREQQVRVKTPIDTVATFDAAAQAYQNELAPYNLSEAVKSVPASNQNKALTVDVYQLTSTIDAISLALRQYANYLPNDIPVPAHPEGEQARACDINIPTTNLDGTQLTNRNKLVYNICQTPD